ncbi:PAS domain-containing protein [Bradyrhizobium sp.]|uniref:PAS domain-containing protein n=1 Tax=Bradyrhizobium sp. TaxID=376 RepID=UPI00352601A5
MLKVTKPGSADFLAGGGEMGALTRAFDWSASPLGEPGTWPQSLRTAVRLVLNSNHPMFVWWGPELVQFYNDAYRRTMGPERHPSALGQRGRECWAEIWPLIGPQIEQVMSGGGAIWQEKQLVPVTRYGKLEQVYWTYSYSPIDEDGGIGGVLVVCQDVTRDVVAAAALREREAELARVQQLGRIGGLEVDLRTGFRNRRSPEYLLIHGLPPDAAQETHEEWVQRVHPEDREAAERKFRDAVAGDVREYSVQYRIIRPSDGEVRWISVKSTIERDENGKAIRLVGAHSDVTEQVVADQALRQSEAEFRTLAEALPHHVWTATPDGSLNWFNPRVYEYAGVGTGELDGQQWGRIVHPDDIPGAFAAWTRAIADGKPYEIEFRLRRADGDFRWFLARAVPARDEQGQIIRWIGTNTDVHDQKLIADQLAELNATLAQRVEEKTRERDRIWNVSQDLLLVSDRDGIWRTVNPAWTRTLGWSEAELLGRTSEWLEHPDDGSATRAQVGKSGESEATVRFESRFRHRDGSYRWLSWTGVSDQHHTYTVARDVTAEKAAAERLKATEEALLQSQKMEAVGQLTGGIAHDFNNLLTGIVGSLDLLQTRLNQGRTDNVARYINAAMTSANRAAALTHRLLAFARRQPLIPKSVDANALVVSLEDLLRRTIGETIDLEIVAAGDLWGTLCDPNQLESALLNLAINARDAMPDGGRLVIATANAKLDGAAANTPALSPGEYICITVTDTGVGMSAEVTARAFDPFFTTKPIGQGTGLGLSMIYGFARQSNGHVTIDSRVGQGTSVRLYLPRHQGKVDARNAPEVRAADHAATGETVLVVEDEPVVRAVILEMLGEQGYRMLEAVDGPSGLKILRSGARIDLLVTDVGLPGMNGRQLADQARETRPDLKILFITGYAESVAIADGFLQPGMEMITKPFDLDNLSRRIRSMVSG